jgi:putative peptidoglycan lipid II flippase
MGHSDLIRRARGVVNVNALVVAALGLGLLANVLIAGLFGLSHRVDAFFAAAVLPNLVMLFSIDYLGKNFLPVLASAKAVSQTCASSVTSSIVTMVALLAAAVTALLVVFSRPLFGALLPGFDAAALDLVSRYFTIMAPCIVLMTINTFHEYVWQYEEQFTYVSLSKTALPAANLLCLLLLAPWLGEYCLPVGYLVGHIAVFLLLLRRLPYRYRPHVALRPGFERRVFANSAIVMSTGLVARGKSIVMNYLASQLGSGAITALALASKLTEPLERSAFTGIRMLMFSQTVRLVVARDRRGLGNLYSMGLRASFLVLAPFLCWMALNSETLVQALFGRGEFTAEMATLVAAVLVGLAPSVLFLGVNQLLSNAFYAMDRVAVPATVMPLGTLIYVAAAFPLAAAFGTQGLAAALSTAAIAVFIALLVIVARHVPEIGLLRTGGALAFYALLGGTAMLGAVVACSTFGWTAGVIAAASLPIGAAAYGAALYFGGDPTFRKLLELVHTYAARVPSPGTGGVSADRLSADRSSKAPRARKSD